MPQSIVLQGVVRHSAFAAQTKPTVVRAASVPVTINLAAMPTIPVPMAHVALNLASVDLVQIVCV